MGYIAQFLAGIVGCNHAMGEGKLNALSRTDTPRQARLLPSRMPGIWSLGQGNRQTAQPGPRFVVGLRRQPCGAPPGAATIGADARLRRPPGATIIGACGATSAPRPARQSSGPTARLRRRPYCHHVLRTGSASRESSGADRKSAGYDFRRSRPTLPRRQRAPARGST